MKDVFALIAIVVSASILPALAVILLWTLRRVGREHRDLVGRHFGPDEAMLKARRAAADDYQLAQKTAPSEEERMPAKGKYIKLDSHLPETFDEVHDKFVNPVNEPASVRLAARRSLLEEHDLGFS